MQEAAGAAAQTPLPIIPLGETISWTHQAYPGGTGAILDKLLKERGAKAFERPVFEVEKWSGPVPTKDEDITAFLPAHRLSALIKERKITSARLTDIYLARLNRLNPTLLCAVTILDSHAREEAARADAEIAAGKYRGPLHGIPYGAQGISSRSSGLPHDVGAPSNSSIRSSTKTPRLSSGCAMRALFCWRNSRRVASPTMTSGFRGRTNNPWDIRRGSSGSSAGPHRRRQAGCVAFGIGTETSGSIVSPSRECGLLCAASHVRPGEPSWRHGAGLVT